MRNSLVVPNARLVTVTVIGPSVVLLPVPFTSTTALTRHSPLTDGTVCALYTPMLVDVAGTLIAVALGLVPLAGGSNVTVTLTAPGSGPTPPTPTTVTTALMGCVVSPAVALIPLRLVSTT